ncbi:hypothetical protein K466DRAFT_324413 [Polyporus arcularius HHB13444]|uniref:Uncharacterized protein n=1 Tax=Polyporus arcularius HHB13444 TaxID=1314778 RepID=A0A5C3NWN9_9APHY|nr:hypothetical protein K466DRAFT_324413 [Polyporus arcularius HHB13444]
MWLGPRIGSCCINKESGSELPAAINSMFRWYEQAEVYSYMKDGAFNDGPHSASSLLDHFQWPIALPTSYVPGTYCKHPVFLAGRASRWSHLSLRLNDPAARLASRKSVCVLTSWGSDKCYSINRRLKYHRSSPAPQRTHHRPLFWSGSGQAQGVPAQAPSRVLSRSSAASSAAAVLIQV